MAKLIPTAPNNSSETVEWVSEAGGGGKGRLTVHPETTWAALGSIDSKL